jgi:hypothetical protein
MSIHIQPKKVCSAHSQAKRQDFTTKQVECAFYNNQAERLESKLAPHFQQFYQKIPLIW